MAADDAGQGFLRAHKLFHPCLGQEAKAAGTVGAVEQGSLVSDDEGAAAGEFAAGLEVDGDGRLETAIIPRERDGRAGAAGGKRVANNRGARKRL